MKIDKLLAGTIALVLIAGLGTLAFADSIQSNDSGGGDWDDNSSWDGGNIPNGSDEVTILSGDEIIISNIVTPFGSGNITIQSGGALTVNGTAGGIFRTSMDINNSGDMTFQGGDQSRHGSFRFFGVFTNECFAVVHFIGGSEDQTGSFRNDGNVFNGGTFTFEGGDGFESGSLNNEPGNFTNHNTLTFIPGSGTDSGALVGNGIIEDPIPCPEEVVGGELLPIDSTALLLAAAQSPAAWMTSITFAIIGVGAFLITRNPNNMRNIKAILRDYLERF